MRMRYYNVAKQTLFACLSTRFEQTTPLQGLLLNRTLGPPRDEQMLIYLDANIVQYCADYGDFVFGREGAVQPSNRNLKMELRALGEAIELAVHAEVQDLDHRWEVAAPRHLLEELSRGNLSQEQLDTYRLLREAWQDLGIEQHASPDIEMVNTVETRLRRLNLRDPPDRRHLAEAVAIGASWFITLDKDIIKKTRDEPSKPTKIEGVIVGRPSELRRDWGQVLQ
jgi:predicted nucleic acid-binding protein